MMLPRFDIARGPLRWWARVINRSSQLSGDEILDQGYRVIGLAKSGGKTLLGQQGYARSLTCWEKLIWSMSSAIPKAAWEVAQDAIAVGAKRCGCSWV